MGFIVTGTCSSLILAVMLDGRAALDMRSENSDFGATSTLFLSTEKGGGVKAEKITWLQGSVLLAPGLASYAHTVLTEPQRLAAITK